MEGGCVSLVNYNSPSYYFHHLYHHYTLKKPNNLKPNSTNPHSFTTRKSHLLFCHRDEKNRNHHHHHRFRLFSSNSAPSSFASAVVVEPQKTSEVKEMPRIDKSGRFCSPRAARELSLLTIYGACLEGSDPVRLFERRLNGRREPGYEFDKNILLEFNHMSFGGPPVSTDTLEEADELLRSDERESFVEAQVLLAPPKLVYSKLLLRFTRKLLIAVVDRWDAHALVIDKVAPPNWKNEPASRILEFCILHLAMSEISVLGTRHQIVINEAVDLAKRFCDGAAPRIINGCLRTFVKDHLVMGTTQSSVADQKVEG